MRRTPLTLCGWLFVGLCVCALPARALVVPMDVGDLSRAAQRIVVAQVQDVTAAWDGPGRAIFTTVRLAVEETLAGPPAPPQLTIRIPGGTVGNLRCVVTEVPTFAEGERCLLFLEPGRCPLVGGWQGKKALHGERLANDRMTLGDVRGLVRRLRADSRIAPGKRVVERLDYVDPTGVPQLTGVGARGLETILTETFEGAFPSGLWTLTGNPTWGKDTYLKHAGSYSAFCAKSGSNGVNPPAYYPNYCDSRMTYGPFDLSDATSAELSWWDWTYTEPGNDLFLWYASSDGINYSGAGASGGPYGWYNGTFDLTSYCGDSTVWIMFRFYSNSSITYPGVWVDDVAITKDVPGVGLTITDITPGAACAGISESVTITGSNFGATQGTSKVEFFYRTGYSKLEAASYSSWSDTEIECTVPADASSGPVTVWTAADGTSSGYELGIVFGYGGYKWYAASIPVGFRVNPNTSDCSGEESAVAAAASTWNTNDNGSAFSLSYQGTTSDGVPGSSDGKNICWWATDLPSGTPAWNVVWVTSDPPDKIVEFDIEFNDDYAWSTDGSAWDVETVALHEFGHALQLADVYGTADSAKAMYGLGSSGQIKRTLHAGDTSGIFWIYPSPTVARLTDVMARSVGGGTRLRFSYADPRPLAEFHIERRAANGQFVAVGSVACVPNRCGYDYVDVGRCSGPRDYRIVGVSLDGVAELLWPLVPAAR